VKTLANRSVSSLLPNSDFPPLKRNLSQAADSFGAGAFCDCQRPFWVLFQPHYRHGRFSDRRCFEPRQCCRNPNRYNRTLMRVVQHLRIRLKQARHLRERRTQFHGRPGGYQPDLDVFRDFPFQVFDRPQFLELRVEAFNAFNHTEFAIQRAPLRPNNSDRFWAQQRMPASCRFR
jgi:hypothetical protein